MRKIIAALLILSICGCRDYGEGDYVKLRDKSAKWPRMIAARFRSENNTTIVTTVRWANGQRICEDWCESELELDNQKAEKE